VGSDGVRERSRSGIRGAFDRAARDRDLVEAVRRSAPRVTDAAAMAVLYGTADAGGCGPGAAMGRYVDLAAFSDRVTGHVVRRALNPEGLPVPDAAGPAGVQTGAFDGTES